MSSTLLVAVLVIAQTSRPPIHAAGALDPKTSSGQTAARVFMTPDGAQHEAPITGPTRVAIAPGGTREIMVWMQNTSGATEGINAYQLIFPWFAEPHAGATGTVGYHDTPSQCQAGCSLFGASGSYGSLCQDQCREDWIFVSSLGTDVGVAFNETPGVYCGILYAMVWGIDHVPDPDEIYYLVHLKVVASADASGAFEFKLRRFPETPPWSSLFNIYGAPYQLDHIEYQPLEIAVVAAPVSSTPPDGAIDARQPGHVDGGDPDGWRALELTFATEPVASAADFAIQASGGIAPAVEDVLVGGRTVTVLFDGPIPDGECTTIRHVPTGWSTHLGYLPGDVNGDGASGPVDILALIDGLNGVRVLEDWQCDIDRSESCQPADILRLIDLLNGAGAYDAWNGAVLPQCP